MRAASRGTRSTFQVELSSPPTSLPHHQRPDNAATAEPLDRPRTPGRRPRSRLERDVSAANEIDDPVDDGVGVSIRISNDVAPGEHCSIELLVHVPRRSLVGESMVAPRRDAVHTRRYRREQHDVLHPSTTARRDEATEEPWYNDAVVDRPVAAGDESAGRARADSVTISF